MEPVALKVNIVVPVERVHDLLTCAVENGTAYWCCWDHLPYKYNQERRDWDLRLPVGIVDELDDNKRYDVTWNKLAKGLQVMADKYDWHFQDFMAENEDIITGDVFLQCALFGEIRYG